MLGVRDTAIDNPRNRPAQAGSSRVQAVVTIAAPFLITATNFRSPLAVRVVMNLMGTLPLFVADTLPLTPALADASPITHVTAAAAPMLMYHAADDPLILSKAMTLMEAKLAGAGVARQAVMRSDGGHSPKYDVDEMDRWYQRYLRPERR